MQNNLLESQEAIVQELSLEESIKVVGGMVGGIVGGAVGAFFANLSPLSISLTSTNENLYGHSSSQPFQLTIPNVNK